MPTAYAATGTLVKIGDGGGTEVFTTIPGVKDITLFGFTLDTVETTSHDASGFKTYIATLKDSGDVSFDMNFTAAAPQGFATGLFNDNQNRTLRNFQVFVPGINKTASFAALVTTFSMKNPVNDVITASVTLKTTGAVTWA
jgi:predicted secreted protein